MGLQLFEELNRTTAAYCRSMGLDPTPYESKLSAEEVEIAHLMRNGMSRSKAERWAPVNIFHGVSAGRYKAIVEYAQTPAQRDESIRLFGESLGKYYAECRSRSTISPCFVGD